VTGDKGPGHDERTDQDPRIEAGLEHLQRAASELIAASRALLDVAEELVEDPAAAASIIEVLGSITARRSGGPARTGTGRPREHGPAAADQGAHDDGEPPVQRIPVS